MTAFIGHAPEDLARVEELVRCIEDQGVACWYAARDTTPGHSQAEDIVTAIENADAVVVLLTEQANESRNFLMQVETAAHKNKLLYPVFLDAVHPSRALELYVSSSRSIAAAGLGPAQVAETLARALQPTATAPAAAPPREDATLIAPAAPSVEFRELRPGSMLGQFLVKRELGQGAMGQVFLARQLSMDRDVALKILPPALAMNQQMIERFRNEVRQAAKVDHPNIVTAYEAGEDSGVLYLAMAYVAGESLDKKLAREGSLPEAAALTIIRKVAGALQVAWEDHRLLHRDIKPGNIMLTRAGEPKLTDMGLSKSLDIEEGLTAHSVVLGSPNYMSPEQAQGSAEIDYRSDIYALGTTLYHLLTGKIPFGGSSVMDTLRKQITESLPDPRLAAPGISEASVDLMEIMLAKNPAERFQSYDDLLADIDRVLAGASPAHTRLSEGASVLLRTRATSAIPAAPVASSERPVPAATAPRRRSAPPATSSSGQRLVVAAAVALSLLAAIGGVMYWNTRDASAPPAATGEPSVPAKVAPAEAPPPAATTKPAAARSEFVAVAPAAASGRATGATLTASATAPAITADDRANYGPVAGTDKWWANSVGSVNTGTAKGQTFITGDTAVWLKAITYQLAATARAEPTKTYVVRVGSVSGTRFTEIRAETVTQTFSVPGGAYLTWTLGAPVPLSPRTTYAVDIGMTGSTTTWKTGIPYLNVTANTYAGGQLYLSGDNGVGTSDLVLSANRDRVFHLDLERRAESSPPRGAPAPAAAGSGADYALRFAPGDGVRFDSLTDATESLTMECWIVSDMTQAHMHLIGASPKYHLITGSNGQIAFRGVGGHPPPRYELSRNPIAPLPSRTKTHLAVVRDAAAGQHRLYINGELVDQLDKMIPPTRQIFMICGKERQWSSKKGRGYSGLMDEIRLSSSVRYHGDFTPPARFVPDDDTLALYHCDEGAGTLLRDSSGNNHHGQIEGAQWEPVAGPAPRP